MNERTYNDTQNKTRAPVARRERDEIELLTRHVGDDKPPTDRP